MTVDALTKQEDTTLEATTDSATEPAASSEPTTDPTGSAPEAATAPSTTDEEPAKGKRGRPKGGTTARKTRTVELTLTVTGTADGNWQAELKHGTKWIAQGLEIPAAAVSRAAAELHVDLSGPIDEVINAAREVQAAKVAQLEAELEQAKQALAELDS
jgi:cellulase/cellobiase CelA1